MLSSHNDIDFDDWHHHKGLFATTALVATTGFAAADVTLSGSAQMGIMGGENMDVQFVQDIDVTFTMSGETDNGLTFGAAIDLDEDAGAVGTDDAGVAIFISGDFGTLTMGDTDGALDWALQDAGIGPASINDDHTVHAGYNGNNQFDSNAPVGAVLTDILSTSFSFDADDDELISIDVASDDLGSEFGGLLWSKWEMFLDGEVDIDVALSGYDGQILRYDYSVGGFGVAVSVQLDDDELLDPMWGIGATYETATGAGTFTAGIAYQSGEIALTVDATPSIQFWGEATNTEYLVEIGTTNLITTVGDFDGAGISLGYEINGFEIVGNFTRHEISFGSFLDIEVDHAALGVAYTVDAFSIGANWGQYDVSVPTLGVSDNVTGWGLAAAYDLGGGLSAHLGYGDGETFGVEEDSTWSFGLNMAF